MTLGFEFWPADPHAPSRVLYITYDRGFKFEGSSFHDPPKSGKGSFTWTPNV